MTVSLRLSSSWFLTLCLSVLLGAATTLQAEQQPTVKPSSALQAAEPVEQQPASDLPPELKKQEPFRAGVQTFNYARHYILGPNDVISVSFFGASDLNITSLRIPPDGHIMLPATTDIMAAGMTLQELRAEISRQMEKYLHNTQVSINLIQAKPFAVPITGAVMNPGTYEININATGNTPFTIASGTKPDRATPLLSSLLITAGGVSYDADLESVHIINELTREKFTVNLLDLLAGHVEGDLFLAYGDRIQVDRLPTAFAVNPDKFKQYQSATFSPATFPVRVYGYVRSPGVISIDPKQSNNLNSAIMQAGGYYPDFAYAPQKVVLMRYDGHGKMVTTELEPKANDITLLPNDMIYVPERGLSKINRAADFIGRLVSPAATIAGTYNSWALLVDPTRNFR